MSRRAGWCVQCTAGQMLGQIVGMVLACILVSKQADGSRKANASLLANVLVDTQ